MLFHHLKIAFRNYRRNRGNSILNAAGLAISIVASMYMLFFVSDELSYDGFHRDSGRIYRVVVDVKTDAGVERYATTPPPLAPVLVRDFPQVERAVRFMGNPRMPVRYGTDKIFYESRFYYVDPGVFGIFDIPFARGDAKTALQRPGTVVITESTARRYFGDEEPMGKLLRTWRDFEITGVVKNPPRNSHLQYEFLSSSELLASGDWMKNWSSIYAPSGWNYSYVKLREGVDVENFVKLMKDTARRIDRDQVIKAGLARSFDLQSIKDIHLKSQRRAEAEPPGSVIQVVILSSISIFLLLIACFNFINMTIAQAASRAKEIGIRKAVGARRSQLIFHFLGESMVFLLSAMALAILLLEIALPWLNELSGKELPYTFILTPSALLIMIAVAMVIVLTAGSYPAVVSASFLPAGVFRSGRFDGSHGVWNNALKKLLIIFQFAVSIIMTVAALTMTRQFRLINDRPLGFDAEKKLVLNAPLSSVWKLIENHETIKKELSDHSAVLSACVSSSVPGRDDISHFQDIRAPGDNYKTDHSIYALQVDHEFIDTYGIRMKAGRAFKRDLTTDEGGAILINEAAVKEFGWTSPEKAIGKRLLFQGNGLEIVGVCEDFHFHSLHRKIEPLFLDIFPDCYACVTLSLNARNLSETMAFIKGKWEDLFQGESFDYFFLDDMLDQQYGTDRRLNRIILIFAFLAIGVSALGLFGMTSMVMERSIKRIGIRKVLGSSVPGIVYLLLKETIIVVALSNGVAWPVAWYAMNEWLQNFAYRIHIGWWIFALSGLLALLIAALTVGFLAVKAATANPVEALRYE